MQSLYLYHRLGERASNDKTSLARTWLFFCALHLRRGMLGFCAIRGKGEAANPSRGKAALYDKAKSSDRSPKYDERIDREPACAKKKSIVDRVTNSDVRCSARDELGRAVNKAC